MIEPVYEVSWDQLPDMPVGKWEPASLVLNDKLYVLGGYENHVVSSRRVDVFDPADGSWTNCRTARAVCPMSTWSLTAMAFGLQEA